ncbi:MAG: putative drug exporter of the superfamily [Micromonosporaceae bacterium]
MVAGVTARIGRWCFRRRWWVLAGWLAVVALGVIAAGPVVDSLASGETPKNVESVQAQAAIDAAGGTGGEVIGLVDGIDPTAPAAREAVGRAAADLSSRTDVRRVDTPYSGAQAAQAAYLSDDRQAAAIVVTLAPLDQKRRDQTIDAVTERLHRLGTELRAAGQAQARVRVGGQLAIDHAAVAAEEHDLGTGEELSLPLTLLALVVVFAGLVAAGLPVLGAIVSIASAMLMLLGFSAVTTLDTNVLTVVTLLGLGLSIDYGLLLVSRYREEVGAGGTPEEAVGRAWATAGRTILFSALTVAAALSGLLMFDLPGLSALGAAGVSVAVVAMLVALTFTPALIGLAHRRLAPSPRASRRAARRSADRGFFARTAHLVQRRPVLVTLGAAALLLLAAAPLTGTRTMLPGLAQMPGGIESVQVAGELGSRFGLGQAQAVTVVARSDPAALDAWAARWTTDRAVRSVRPARPAAPGLSTVDLEVAAGPPTPATEDLVRRVRADRPPGVASWTTGDAARLVDLKDLIARGLPGAIGVAVLAMLLLLLVMTGSLVVPLKAVAANVLSLAATLGVMTGVFVHGWLSGPLHTLTVPGLDPFVTVIILAFAFGLSMDYEVFLLSRIKEYVDAGSPSDEAVRRGLQSSGRIITSAALLMMIVFACFGGARMGSIEELGIGLTVAVLIDATVVRCLLVPATMTLLGRWNWWSPAPLRAMLRRPAPVA